MIFHAVKFCGQIFFFLKSETFVDFINNEK